MFSVSDIVVQIVDARNPLLFRCPDLVRIFILNSLKVGIWWGVECVCTAKCHFIFLYKLMTSGCAIRNI